MDTRLERFWQLAFALQSPSLLTLTLERIFAKGRDSTVVLSGRQCTKLSGSFLLRRCRGSASASLSASTDVAGSSSAAACGKRSSSIASYMLSCLYKSFSVIRAREKCHVFQRRDAQYMLHDDA